MENIALLNAIIENAIDGIITIDDRGKVESINPSACKLFGYEQNEVIGNNIAMLMPTPDRQITYRQNGTSIRAGGYCIPLILCRARRPD